MCSRGNEAGRFARRLFQEKNYIKTPRLIPPYPQGDRVIPNKLILRVYEGLTSEGSPPFGRE